MAYQRGMADRDTPATCGATPLTPIGGWGPIDLMQIAIALPRSVVGLRGYFRSFVGIVQTAATGIQPPCGRTSSPLATDSDRHAYMPGSSGEQDRRQDWRTATHAKESHAVTDALNSMIARTDLETEMRTHTSTAGIRFLSKGRQRAGKARLCR